MITIYYIIEPKYQMIHLLISILFLLLSLSMPKVADAQPLMKFCENSSIASLGDSSKHSLFDHIYRLEGRPKVKVTTNVNRLIRKKLEEPYQDAEMELSDASGNILLDLSGRIRARGNTRKKVSYLPPVKLDFKKSTLDSLGFLKTDKLKLVLPFNTYATSQELLLKEFLLYQIYSLLDSNYLRVKLVDLSFEWKGKERFQTSCFLIEDEDDYKRRLELHIVESGVLRGHALDREPFLKMIFFQYMIANTDWSVIHMHNLEMVKLPNVPRVVAMPYDFDFSGFVGHDYAAPHPVVPIKRVQERYFFPHYKMTKTEFQWVVDYYLSMEEEIYSVCEKATFLNEKTVKESKAYFEAFFDLLRGAELEGVMVRF